jgi:hypothetical protein
VIEAGAARRLEGRIECFAYEPIDSSFAIARAIAERFAANSSQRRH